MDTVINATPAPQASQYPQFQYNGWTVKHSLIKKPVFDKTAGTYVLVEVPTFLKVGHSATYEIGEREYMRYLAYNLNGNSWEGV